MKYRVQIKQNLAVKVGFKEPSNPSSAKVISDHVFPNQDRAMAFYEEKRLILKASYVTQGFYPTYPIPVKCEACLDTGTVKTPNPNSFIYDEVPCGTCRKVA